MILIQDDIITEVCVVAMETTVIFIQTAELMNEFRDWNPEDYTEWFIGPGLVDINVTANPQWESLERLTLTALVGGVTTLLVQPSLFSPLALEPHTLYCDLGKVKIVSSAEDCCEDRDWPELAWKTYLFPPSAQVADGRTALKEILKTCGDTPLIVEPSLPSARMLFQASPYRLSSLEERTSGNSISDEGLVAAALPDEISPSSSRSSDDDSMDYTPHKTSSNLEHTAFLSLPFHELSLGIPDAPQTHEAHPSLTLMQGVMHQVKDSQSDITLLSAMELNAYSRAGATTYGCNSASTSNSEASCPPPDTGELNLRANTLFSERMKRLRPSFLSTDKPKSLTNQEVSYQLHLANCPEQWELNGISLVLDLLSEHPQVRVHFASLTSAASVSLILQRHKPLVSCETAAVSLSFCMEDVRDGDTRFKTFPSLRNKTNLNLLWDLLKLEAIDQINSVHSSVPPELKCPSPPSFRRAVNGMNSLGATLPAVWSKLNVPDLQSREHYAVRLFKWMSLNPAKFLRLQNKGRIEAGMQADLVVWAPYERFVFHSESLYARMSPYEGMDLCGKVHKVYVRGRLAYDEGQISAWGEPLSRK